MHAMLVAVLVLLCTAGLVAELTGSPLAVLDGPQAQQKISAWPRHGFRTLTRLQYRISYCGVGSATAHCDTDRLAGTVRFCLETKNANRTGA